jgi:hypothetical protein
MRSPAGAATSHRIHERARLHPGERASDESRYRPAPKGSRDVPKAGWRGALATRTIAPAATPNFRVGPLPERADGQWIVILVEDDALSMKKAVEEAMKKMESPGGSSN